jgi:putative transposase
MEPVFRKVKYRLYPSRAQEARLLEQLEAHRKLYNAALEQRIDAWRRCGKRVTYPEQARELTELRADSETFRRINAQSAQVTLARLELAFKAFFRRHKKGETPGFPRFKSRSRFPGWGYKTHGCGFRLISRPDRRHGKLRLSGIGNIAVRGRGRNPGEVRTCEICRKGNKWYATFSVSCAPERRSGALAIGLDWGVATLAAIAYEDGGFENIENPRFLRTGRTALETLHQELSRKERGSKNRVRAQLRFSEACRKIANRRHDFLHQLTARIVTETRLIASEELNVRAMTASAKGTVDRPGRRVAQKAGLNREILSAAPGLLIGMLRYKAAEAGVKYVDVPTKKVKPTQRCCACWATAKKALSERQQYCSCGSSLSRDENSARVNLAWALLQRPGTDRVPHAYSV